MYTKIVQIKIFFDNEFKKIVHQIPTYIKKNYKLHITCKKFRLKTTWNLKSMFFIHTTMYKLYTMYTNINRIKYAPADVWFMYTTPLHSLLFEFLHQ